MRFSTQLKVSSAILAAGLALSACGVSADEGGGPGMLIGRGGGLKGNQHLAYPANTPHANILVTMLHRAGVPSQDYEKFADTTGPLSEA